MNANYEWVINTLKVDGNAAHKRFTPSYTIVEDGAAVSFDLLRRRHVAAGVRSQ